MKEDKITGSKAFQDKAINWSYRKRGSVPRTQIKEKENNKQKIKDIKNEELQARAPVKNDMKRIDRYSERKRITKPEPEYSTL